MPRWAAPRRFHASWTAAERRRAEVAIPSARLFSPGATLLLVWLDPPAAVTLTGLTGAVMAAYLLAAAIMWLRLRTAHLPSHRIRVLAQGIDLLWGGLLTG